MATLPGRCVNDLYCTVATSGEVVSVPAEGKFVCPGCSKTLVPPNTPLRRRARGRNRGASPSPTGVAALVLGLGGFAGGILLGAMLFSGASGDITALSSARLAAVPTQDVEALSQPDPIAVNLRSVPRRRHRVEPAGGSTSDSGRAPTGDSTLADAILH